jgi:hypothetical protein
MEISRCIDLAAGFLKRHGRPLDINFYRYHCENAPKDAAVRSLTEYQNSDGGFGWALEPDLRLPASSVIATTIAFQLMRSLNLSAHDALVQTGMNYLLHTFQHDEGGWESVPPQVDEAPHAPWWKYDADVRGRQWANPRAEIIGYLYEYPSISPVDLREGVLVDALERLAAAGSLEMHEVRCFVRLLESPNLPPGAAKTILDKLLVVLPDVVESNSEKWDSYRLRPLDVVSSPDSPLFRVLEHLIPQNIEYLVQQQHPQGYWSPTWSWEYTHRDAWQQALLDWRSLITLNNVLALRAFSNAEGDEGRTSVLA